MIFDIYLLSLFVVILLTISCQDSSAFSFSPIGILPVISSKCNPTVCYDRYRYISHDDITIQQISTNAIANTKTRTKLFLTTSDQLQDLRTIIDIQNTLRTLIQPTNRGRAATPSQRMEINTQLSLMEEQCSLAAPARSPLVEGTWTVQYTDAPPPSNGKLGIFDGVAQQQVSGVIPSSNLANGDKEKCYRNILRVPPNDWLVANLDAIWEEWDGIMLEDTNPGSWKTPGMVVEEGEEQNDIVNSYDTNNVKKNESIFDKLGALFGPSTTTTIASLDYGASNWLVTFQSITIRLFGVTLFKKEFDATQRVWRTTYVDEHTRIVRAGRTGSIEDELVFYMIRAKDADVI